MRSSRNGAARVQMHANSLIDWKMRSSRNLSTSRPTLPVSLIDWKMRSSRNSHTIAARPLAKFNRLENAL